MPVLNTLFEQKWMPIFSYWAIEEHNSFFACNILIYHMNTNVFLFLEDVHGAVAGSIRGSKRPGKCDV